jgi:hypothetical protein
LTGQAFQLGEPSPAVTPAAAVVHASRPLGVETFSSLSARNGIVPVRTGRIYNKQSASFKFERLPVGSCVLGVGGIRACGSMEKPPRAIRAAGGAFAAQLKPGAADPRPAL